MRRLLVAMSLLLLTSSLTACGGERSEPASSFEEHGQRLFEKFDGRGDFDTTIDIPRGQRIFAFSIDCAGGEADIELAIKGLAAGSIPCPSNGRRSPAVTASTQTAVPAGAETLKVSLEGKGSDDVRWSVAVDSRP